MQTPDHKAPQKVRLKRETLRVLSAGDLATVAGGFIMKDTIIIRTSGIVASPDPVTVKPAGR